MGSTTLKGIFSSEQQVSTVGLTYSANHAVNRCSVTQALLFHVQSAGRVEFTSLVRALGFSDGE